LESNKLHSSYPAHAGALLARGGRDWGRKPLSRSGHLRSTVLSAVRASSRGEVVAGAAVAAEVCRH
jgi:hypothetical protein